MVQSKVKEAAMVAVMGYRLRIVAGAVRELVRGTDGVAQEVGAVIDLAAGELRIAGANEGERLTNAFNAGRDTRGEQGVPDMEPNVTPVTISDRARCGPPPGLTTDLSDLLRRRIGDRLPGE